MSLSSEYVDDASDWAKAIVLAETSCAGDYGNAMRRVARRLGIPHSLLWNLHYRPPKSIPADAFEALGTKYADEQKRRHQGEANEYHARTALGSLLLRGADALDRAADALDRQEDGSVK